jgi:hypothetical protein
MLLSSEQKLDDLIIQWLVAHPLSTAEQLHQLARRTERACSIQAIYLQLAKLEQIGVIRKIRQRYILHMNWVNEFSTFADKMVSSYQQSNPIKKILPEEGEQIVWRLPSIAIAVRSMTQVVLALLEVYENQPFCEWAPLIWFHLATGDEQSFLDSLEKGRHSYYLCSGTNTALDRSYKAGFPKIPGGIRLAECPLKSQPRHHTAVVGDYYIQCKFPSGLERDLHEIAKSFEEIAQRTPSQLSNIVNRSERITISVSCSRRRAQRFTNSYRRYFGFEKTRR